MPDGSANPIQRRVAAVISILAAVWFCYAGSRHALAFHYETSRNFEDWERATRIEPDNPEIWYHLGRFRQLDIDNSDIPLAISYYQRAMKLNPRSPYYKLDLASAYEMVESNGEADSSFRAAQAAYPISAEVSWKYGNFLLRQDRLQEAYAEIHSAILVDHSLIPLAVSRVWRSNPDVHLLLDQVLPPTAEAYMETLSFLIDEKEASAALEVWPLLIAKDPQSGWKLSFRLTDLLVAQEKFDEAGAIWRQAVSMNPDAASGYTGNSLVFDGGFEKEITGGGFGWRQNDVEGVDFDFDTDMKHSGSRSARLIFEGTKNLWYENLFQEILVSPSTHYRFQGFLRTDGISTDSGMRFEILDAKDPQHVDVITTNETGTLPWTLEQVDFTTGPKTRMILIRLIRKASERLDNKLHGTVWIDDVSLVPIAGNEGSRPAKN